MFTNYFHQKSCKKIRLLNGLSTYKWNFTLKIMVARGKLLDLDRTRSNEILALDSTNSLLRCLSPLLLAIY